MIESQGLMIPGMLLTKTKDMIAIDNHLILAGLLSNPLVIVQEDILILFLLSNLSLIRSNKWTS